MDLTDARRPPLTFTQARPGYGNPGSALARKLGCICPTIDNQYGRGYESGTGRAFWIRADCALHADVDSAAAPERGE